MPEHAPAEGLKRGVGPFASFAAGFSFVSILTTVFQLFGHGFGFGGAAFFWTWPAVFAGQLLVALCFAELVGRYPISGAIFQWSSRLAGTDVGWFTGWLMVIGQVVTVAVAAIAMQAVLPAIWSGFQMVGPPGAETGPTTATGAQNAVLLGMVVLVATTVINVAGVRLMAVFNSVGVAVEILGVIVLVAVLLMLSERGPGVVLTTAGAAGESSYVSMWLASSLVAAYVLVGFDSAGELAEETRDPRRITPRTIIRALVASGIGGLLIILGGILAAPSLTNGRLAHEGLAWVILSRLGDTGGRLLLVTVAMGVFACTLAVQAAGSRMIFSMAREGTLPFSRHLEKVSDRTGTPVTAAVVVGVGAGIALALNWNQRAVFTALASIAVALIYLAYLGVTLPLLAQRLRHGLPDGVAEDGKPLFSLGRFGTPVTVLAVLFQVGMVVNLLWPRKEIYDLTGETWWLQWSALLLLALVMVAGAGIHLRTRSRRGGAIVLPPVATSAEDEEAAWQRQDR